MIEWLFNNEKSAECSRLFINETTIKILLYLQSPLVNIELGNSVLTVQLFFECFMKGAGPLELIYANLTLKFGKLQQSPSFAKNANQMAFKWTILVK